MPHRLIEAAIARQEGLSLYLHYQPIRPVWQLEGEPVFFEALLRLKMGPTVLTAGHLLPGLDNFPEKMRKLDWWVLGQVAEQMSRDTHRYSVNVSAVTVDDPCFFNVLQRVFRGLETRSRLVLEVTEQHELSDRAIALLTKTNQKLCCVALDDVGAGYGSLVLLKRLHPCGFKIEGELIRSILSDDWSMAIVRRLLDLALDLQVLCIAEYVESAALWGALRDIWAECPELDLYVQGYGVK